MKRFEDLALKLREHRQRKKESITVVADVIGVDRTYLSKLENGHERPSIEILNNLVRHYSLSENEANDLFLAAGYRSGVVISRKEENMDKTDKPIQPGVQINLNGNLPVLYSDSVFITSNPYGVSLDFAVNMGPTNQQNVVSRIGMSKEHAKALAETILRQLSVPNQKQPVNTLKN